MCHQPQYRLAVAAALPRLKQLDGCPISPGEAMQYLAALQLQAFQPAALAGTSRQLVHGQQADEGAFPSASAAGGASGQQTAQPCAEREQPVGGASAAVTVQRIQQVLASFAGTAGPTHLVQQQQQPRQQQQHLECCDSSSPIEELHALLRDCPQLAGVISTALQQAGQQSSMRQPQDAAASKRPADEQQQQQQQRRHEPAVLYASIAVQTEPIGEGLAVVAAACEAAEQEQQQQQQRVAALQDEVAALQAELEVQSQAAKRAQQDAAALAQRSQQQVAGAEQAAEQRVADDRQQAAGALERANQELASMQVGGHFSHASECICLATLPGAIHKPCCCSACLRSLCAAGAVR